MKKTLVAIAALAATGAFAQSTVTITGGLDSGYAFTNNKGASFQQVKSNNSYTSNITFLGSEDLGGGTSANFRYELDIDPTLTAANTAGTPASPDNANAANSIGNGYSFVGVKSASSGNVEFGTLNTVALEANGAGQPFGTAIGSGYKTIAIGATRYQKAMSYETPSMSGLTAKLLYVPKDSIQNNGATSSLPIAGSIATNGRDQVTELGLKYLQGPVTLMFSSLSTKSYYSASNVAAACTAATPAAAVNATQISGADGGLGNNCIDGAEYKVNTFSGNYNRGDFTYYGWYQTQRADSQFNSNPAVAGNTQAVLATVNRTAKGLAVKFQATPVLSIQAGLRSITRSAGESYSTALASTLTNAGVPGIGQTTRLAAFGADYALSKRTNVYFRHEAITDDAILSNTSSNPGSGYTGTNQGSGKISNTAIGFRATF